MKNTRKVKEETLRIDKYEKKKSPPDLHEDIIFNILTRIPAELLHKKFTTVCKKWREYISNTQFVIQNAVRNKSELLIQVPNFRCGNIFRNYSLVMDENELDYELNYFHIPRIPRSIPGVGRISSSCNGFFLVYDSDDEGLYVINLVTKCRINLPPCLSNCPHKVCGSALGFDPHTKQFKVVHIYSDGFGIELFTLGSSNKTWKLLPGPFHDDSYKPYDMSSFHWKDPVLIDGQYMHWYVESNRFIISMDVSEEKSVKTNLPNYGLGMKKGLYSLTELGGKLSCVNNVSRAEIDVWILESFQKQVWIKKHTINAEFIEYTSLGGYCERLPKLLQLIAVATLRDGEVIMFKNKQERGRMYLYDIKSMKMKQFKMQMKNGQKFVPHRSSLHVLEN